MPSKDGPALKLAFLWHQHQPYYKSLLNGKYHMPWVRLHGVKDYLDMVEILKDHPSIKQTFNMVPSLLEQILDYADGTAVDPHLELSLIKASELTPDDKARMIETHFQANYDNLIAPMSRFRELYDTRNKSSSWEEQDWLDLQCLSNLAWIDPMFKRSGRLKDLVMKGERFLEEEKLEILEHQKKIMAGIIPALKERMEDGQIEISTTPYFHPIMPLVFDSSSALEAMPGAPMPQNRFRRPEDVNRQVEMAIEMYTSLFKRPPSGMWPSEGSVSEDIIPILAGHGIRWIATDEEILAESCGNPARSGGISNLVTSGDLYRSWKFSKDPDEMTIFFRDHALSDNIGFVYSRWDPEKAALDFVSKLAAIHRNLLSKGISDPIVSVILDGENAWEYFKNDGQDFLNALYSLISKSDWIKTTTFSGHLDENPQSGALSKLFPGSWINHNFSVWIGHEEDNKAWDMLFKAREELVSFQDSNPEFDLEKMKLAWKEIFIAEGSDWCWWFGEDHIGPNNDEFDSLFRAHLANIYYLTDREPPAELFNPIRSSFMLAHILKPINYITPVIDGVLTHYYEWQQAGYFDCLKAGSTMHKSENVISGIWFGFDTDNLYFRIDRGITVDTTRFEKMSFQLEFFEPVKATVSIENGKYKSSIKIRDDSAILFKFVDILEIAIPLKSLTIPEKGSISVRISVREDGSLLESWPPSETLLIGLPGSSQGEIPWIV